MKPEHTPETEEYGVSSFIFRSQRPFHPTRLKKIVNGFGELDKKVREQTGKNSKDEKCSPFAGVIRSKGQIWLANAKDFPLDMHSAGKQLAIEPTGRPYLHAIGEDNWDEEDEADVKEVKDKGR